ncbi:MAG: nucleotidyltransferase domain-containing protein [Candidatus Omnitrophota bacterium]|jgi:predicted nucleotidyltransferase|nr:MAG: nucleotidyltransferase domain-containing protein [Candidatus Omnitrophota bacterium]
MNEKDYEIVKQFKQKLLENNIPIREIIVFGSRARGDAAPDSDMDVLVLLDWTSFELERQVSHCAWEVGFETDIMIQPVVMSHKQAREGPEKSSLLIMAVEKEGVNV